MKRFFTLIIGLILTLPLHVSDAFGLTLSDFRNEVFRPENIVEEAGDATATEKIIRVANFVIDIILYVAGSAAVFMIVLGGIMYIVSLGNQERMDRAKKILSYAVVGLFAIILSYLVVTNVMDLIFRATT